MTARHLAVVPPQPAGPPIAQVLSVSTDRRGVRAVRVRCPFGCRKAHVHGWPAAHPDVGMRVAHCASWPRHSYLVVGAPDVEARRRAGAR